ncbi:iron-siderophore ABC transporter substrate-binding protein [Endozoicomonas arenosclerae]|uniref:ABC transporter substrate-binding protein n=1 Tax=Endozoicomonas arenosclerae TaxID=1633495 RepID=UPI00078528DB|nr:iron-siderophore ABC transporter substrate-binding protein [Endozoicomonas arenosclerae]
MFAVFKYLHVLVFWMVSSVAVSSIVRASVVAPELPEAPEKIVALNWTQAEMLLTLGIKPAGVTSIKGYRKWQSNDPVLPEGVTELGQRAEPGLEAIAALQPDLILGYKWRHSRISSELGAIAPTVLYKQYPSNEDPVNYFIRMQGIFRSVAQLLRKDALAEAKLQEMTAALVEARQIIETAGLAGQKVVVGKFVGMGLGLRVYGDLSLAGAIANEIGLVNDWHTSLPGRDFTHVDLLKLTTIGDASLIIIGSQPENLPDMANSPIWKALPAVKEGRVYYLPALWSFGGPASAARMASAFARHLAPEV